MTRRACVRVACAVAALALALGGCERGADPHLRDRGRVLVLPVSPGSAAKTPPATAGTVWLTPPDVPAAALDATGADPLAASAALRAAQVRGIYVPLDDGPTPRAREDAPLAARFRALEYVPGFEGRLLARKFALYAPVAPVTIDDLGPVLARAARTLLGGAPPPPDRIVPAALLAPQEVELLVMLREDGAPRLWRSAKGPTLISALVTASQAARARWTERAGAMGEDLDDALPRLDVEVALMVRDGTFVSRDPGFIAQATTPGHGVGFEQVGSWHYTLPAATRRAGDGAAALRALFVSNGLPADDFSAPQLRLYRFVVRTIARSRATTGAPRSGSAGASPASRAGSGASPASSDAAAASTAQGR